ncbi:MAG: hypothetical protein HETSPECPRED_007499 [Heterodermia speciosa]|uniref:Major facilitator superfamily (MFS) profile domain-containing protein n=1 Tax=Heterodermia speciosa TaxID=116794 RepID=A0A8H3FRS4_9LECA|nr:MAG: hypothetical protein HETSPECPRED_007499 [Heterodermia speciosa]
MVVMITPVAFQSIGYQTYIIFAVINAFIIPVTYLFYPETAYRSLEEMDSIFRKAHGPAGWFSVVKIAHDEPRRYGKNGELLIAYDETEEHAQRQASVVSASGVDMSRKQRIENVENVDEEGKAEKGVF